MSATRNALWLTVCKVSGDLLNLLFFVLLSRAFGPAGVGVYAYAFAVSGFVYVIGGLGIEDYGLREYSRMQPERARPFLAELLGTQTVMVLVACLGVCAYLIISAPPRTTMLITAAFICYQIAAAFATSLFIPAMAAQRMMEPALADLLTRMTALGIAALLIVGVHASIGEALPVYALAAILWLYLGWRSLRRHTGALRLTISRASLRVSIGSLWSFAISEVFAQILVRIGVITLVQWRGDAAAGVFATGQKLIEMALVPLSFLGLAAYPRLCRLHGTEPEAFRARAVELLWAMVLAGSLLAWGLYYVAPVLLVPLFGARYAGAEPVVQMMCGLALVQAIEVMLGRILFAADLQVARAKQIAASGMICLILSLALVRPLGIEGAVVAGIAAYLVLDVLYVVTMRKVLSVGALMRVFVGLGCAVGVAASVAAAMRALLLPDWVQAGATLLALASLTGLSWFLQHRAAQGAGARAPAPRTS